MAYTLHWQTTSVPGEATSVHADYTAAVAAEAAKAAEIMNEYWFHLWLDDGLNTVHSTERF